MSVDRHILFDRLRTGNPVLYLDEWESAVRLCRLEPGQSPPKPPARVPCKVRIDNTHWTVKERPMAQYVGKRVRLKVYFRTRGGEEFSAGTEMRVDGHWRGKLSLSIPGTTPLRSITKVPRHMVEILT